MSNVARVAGQAANTLVKPLNVEDVFSTYLYDGTGASLTINNGIDLDGEGGMVWVKRRDTSVNHYIFDTERGVGNYIITNSTASQNNLEGVSAFNTEGFSVGTAITTGMNTSGGDYASWTWRKAPKFFDVVTYTGDGVAGRQIAHNLGSVPGCFILKATSTTGDWIVYHRGLSDPSNKALALHLTNAEFDNTYFNDTDPTATHFVVGGQGLGINNSGVSYVAYLFAHNDGDAEFGPDGDADIIKCGSYTGNASTDGPEIDLGFEPQWLLVKNASASANWTLLDVMRGFPVSGSNQHTLLADSTAAELVNTSYQIQPLSDGFQPVSTNGLVNASGNTYIYIAIRRGPMAVPESATDVFAQDYRGSDDPTVPPRWRASFPVDFQFNKLADATGGWAASARLQGTKFLELNNTDAEGTLSTQKWDYMNGHGSGSTSTNVDYWSWMWKRAPNFFDVVAYTGNGTAGHTITHNLGVVPEMIWCKRRDTSGWAWPVYHSGIANDPETDYLLLDSVSGASDSAAFWNDTAPTASDFTVGTYTGINTSGGRYIAYLFASLAGVSKVGSYTGNGTTQNIDCGFSAGARFVLVKRSDAISNWVLWDSERGIVAGNDPFLLLNATSAQNSSYDSIDPYSGGFAMNETANNLNVSGGTYIFYAIA